MCVFVCLLYLGVSSHSMNSESSSDYAVPPDEVSGLNDSSGDSEPEHKLLKYTQTHSTKVFTILKSHFSRQILIWATDTDTDTNLNNTR